MGSERPGGVEGWKYDVATRPPAAIRSDRLC